MESSGSSSESIDYHEQSEYEDLHGRGGSEDERAGAEGIQHYRSEPPARQPEAGQQEAEDMEDDGEDRATQTLRSL